MKRLFFMLAVAAPVLLLSPFGAQAGRDCEHGKQNSALLESAPAGADVQVIAEDTAHDADNTDRNERDRDGDTLTPMDQGKSEGDRTITQTIRKAVVDNDKLSTNAHNVKIITVDGAVTLRGPVKTAEEKATVEALAQKAPGVKAVDNQLEVERDL
jgi:osmotically-inducible protein OsmY